MIKVIEKRKLCSFLKTPRDIWLAIPMYYELKFSKTPPKRNMKLRTVSAQLLQTADRGALLFIISYLFDWNAWRLSTMVKFCKFQWCLRVRKGLLIDHYYTRLVFLQKIFFQKKRYNFLGCFQAFWLKKFLSVIFCFFLWTSLNDLNNNIWNFCFSFFVCLKNYRFLGSLSSKRKP